MWCHKEVSTIAREPDSVSTSAEAWKPGQDCQAVATAHLLGQDPNDIHGPTWGVVGTLGDSICYGGVPDKVNAIHAELARRITDSQLHKRLVSPNYSGGVSDGQRNGTPQMRYSLIGRETTHDGMSLHLEGSDLEGVIAVVACDKPPVGTTAALLERNVPAVIHSDGSIRPGIDPETGETIDLVSCFQVAQDPDPVKRERWARNACPGIGSCGGMFTYNTMQSFIATIGLEPVHMVAPVSEDPRRMDQFPRELVDCLLLMTEQNIRPRDLVTPAALRNGMIVAIAMGGSTNVLLHAPEIARSAGIDFWNEVMSRDEFNQLSRDVPVLINARPFGKYYMTDIEDKGGLQVILNELLKAGLLDGSTLTCTGETLAEQIARLDPPAPDGDVIHAFNTPYKNTGGLRVLSGNLAPDGGAVLKVAGVEGGIGADNRFVGRARTFDSEPALLDQLINAPEVFADNDMVVIRYEGPKGAPGMPEMLDPTSRITTLCRERGITIALMTDARFSGGSVGLVIGHVGPEAAVGGPIALVQDGDTIVVDLNDDTLNCEELGDLAVFEDRQARWQAEAESNGGLSPHVRAVQSRLLKRMRLLANPAILGAGMGEG
ncbi:dihydroxy-acid dehydratase [Naumannella halotolerans]|uniref:Dihydroxy-acid dehydratase n=1 Tax=Naumannella halotolerans TaxID=993414 RepID=A0A4R7J9T8_9ACTN|nr:dihydroxy-acid dehydratase [Naumannella halotolerans]